MSNPSTIIQAAIDLQANHNKIEIAGMARGLGWRGDQARAPILQLALFVATKLAAAEEYQHDYSNEVVAIIIFMILGAGVSFLASLSITTEKRLKIMKIPICIWIYFGISLFSIPLMFLVALDESLKGRLSSLAIPLLVQSLLAFWLDYRLAVWLEKKKSKEERI